MRQREKHSHCLRGDLVRSLSNIHVKAVSRWWSAWSLMFLSILWFRNSISFLVWFFVSEPCLALIHCHKWIYKGKIYIKATFVSCSALYFIVVYFHAHINTHALSLSVRPFCTYIRGREGGLALAELSSNPIFFQRNNSSPYEQSADTASACPCLFGPVHHLLTAKMVMACVDRSWQFTPGHY